jgi:hypothetical protein
VMRAWKGQSAPLKLRALRANGNFPGSWAYHLAQERSESTIPLRQRFIPRAA